MPNPSVEPNDTLLTIIPNRIIDNARLSIAKKIPLNLLTKNPKKKETIKPAKIEKAIRINTAVARRVRRNTAGSGDPNPDGQPPPAEPAQLTYHR